jgi:hypothetical protein
VKESSSFNSSVLEATRTFVPGWWVEAFESAVMHRSEHHSDSESELLRQGAMPIRMDAHELALLALVLGDIQRQVFLTESLKPQIELDVQSLQKMLPANDASSRDRLWTVIQTLVGLRFLTKDHGHDRLKVSYLFASESWSTSTKSGQGPKLCLELAARGSELLCGYIDGHLDWLYDLNGHGLLRPANFSRQPLVLWTPIWLELGLTEQVLYARMEQVMQNQSAWLRLDGLVGASLAGLTTGLKMTKKNPDAASWILDRLRLVVKLGRRLVAHGLLHKEPSTDYMALTEQGPGEAPMLLWQASAERLRSRAEVEYFGLASSRILKGPITECAPRLIECFAQISQNASMNERLSSIWTSIVNAPGCGIHTAPGMMMQSHLLFMEWIARSVDTSLLPMNGVIATHPVTAGLDKVHAENAVRVFAEFTKVLQRSHELGHIAANSDQWPPFSLATTPLRQELRDLLKQKRDPLPSIPVRSEAPANPMGRSKIEPPRVPLNRIPVNTESKIHEKTDQSIQKLRKIAQDELEKMIRQSPVDYAKLKQSFLSSLDSEKKSLVLDVQRRLDSKEFDRQLKPRIVRYMVEHPGAWTSASNTLLL